VHYDKNGTTRLRGINMKRSLVGLCIGLLLGSPTAWGQSSGGNGSDNAVGTSLADQPPAENVRGGAVRDRAPGRIIDFARARHVSLRDARLAAQRARETSALAPEPTAAGTSSSSGSLLSTLLGGLSSGAISSLLSTGLSGTGSTGTDFSSLPPEVIQMLAGAGIDLKDLNQKSSEDSSAEVVTQPKSSSRAQTSDTQEQPKFIVRWADAMLSTFFTALTVGFQTQDFIDLLKDAFRPLFVPQDASTDGGNSGDGASDGGQDSGTGGDGGGGGLI
jgi:hypothetical protein